MSSEEFIRYLSSLVGVAGLVVLAVALGKSFGPWAAGAALFFAGAGMAVPLWHKHFDAMDRARVSAAWRSVEPPKATEEFPV